MCSLLSVYLFREKKYTPGVFTNYIRVNENKVNWIEILPRRNSLLTMSAHCIDLYLNRWKENFVIYFFSSMNQIERQLERLRS